MAIIGDYWDQETVTQVVNLVKEYEDLFPKSFLEMKGSVESIREMTIKLKPDAKLVKKRPYWLNPKYKEKMCKVLDQMLEAGMIVPVEDSNWIILIVVQPKKTINLSICVDLHNLNVACVHDPFSTAFTDEVLENVGGCKAYSFTDGFWGYHQAWIIEEDRAKTTFVT